MTPINPKKIPKHLLHAYTSEELPFKLLIALTETTPRIADENRIGPLSLTRKTIVRLGCRECEQNIDRLKYLELGCKLLKQLFQTIRLNFHMLRIEEWYLMALSLYASSDPDKTKNQIHNLAISSWHDYKTRIGEGVTFAESTWTRFRKLGGKI